jgi:N-acetylglutamate synthase-like GNAT family acetyltransferase
MAVMALLAISALLAQWVEQKELLRQLTKVETEARQEMVIREEQAVAVSVARVLMLSELVQVVAVQVLSVQVHQCLSEEMVAMEHNIPYQVTQHITVAEVAEVQKAVREESEA